MNIFEESRIRQRLPDPDTRRRIRERADLTQQDIADHMGVKPSSVSRWESGERYPRSKTRTRYVLLLENLQRNRPPTGINRSDLTNETVPWHAER